METGIHIVRQYVRLAHYWFAPDAGRNRAIFELPAWCDCLNRWLNFHCCALVAQRGLANRLEQAALEKHWGLPDKAAQPLSR